MQALAAVLVLLLVVTAGVLAGCSSNSGFSTNNNPYGGGGGTGGGGTGGGGSTQSGTASVVMQNRQPLGLDCDLGTTVTWTNDDSTSHTVTFTDISGVDSGTLTRGQTFSYTFTTAGTFHYYCRIHGASVMSGTVTVQ